MAGLLAAYGTLSQHSHLLCDHLLDHRDTSLVAVLRCPVSAHEHSGQKLTILLRLLHSSLRSSCPYFSRNIGCNGIFQIIYYWNGKQITLLRGSKIIQKAEDITLVSKGGLIKIARRSLYRSL